MKATLVSSMEAALVSTAFRFVLDLSLSLLREEYGLLSGFQTDIENLESSFKRIQSVLEDAMALKLEGHAVQDWFEKLANLACHTENVLDEFNFELQRRKIEYNKCHVREVRDFFSCNNQLIFRVLMAHKIKGIRGEMDSFAKETSTFNLGQAASAERQFRIKEVRVTYSYVSSSDVVGRDEEKERIMGLLKGDNDFRTINVVSIVGVGGVGKTTLAQLIYNDERVDRHFDLKLWVCVSDDFGLSRLMKSILELVTERKSEISELDHLQGRLRKELGGKRFLLILDDVWNEEQDKWEDLERLLRSGVHGSKIMVTTRSRKVSSIMGSTEYLQLNPLSDDLCWDLFRRRAFEIGTNPKENLVAIGKEIVKKCGGLPIASKALGSLMRFKQEEADWKSVLESETWQIFDSDHDDKVMPALKLSYDHLSAQSKQCFALCSLFPKDYEMDKERLVHQWMCNGFVQNERVGLEVFNDLVWRSFFLEAKIDGDGRVVKCKMHDLMHDMARFIAGRHFCVLTKDMNSENIYKITHHLLVDKCSAAAILDALKKAKSLRTFLLECANQVDDSIMQKIFIHLRYVRVLDLSSNGIKILPNSLGSLIHLRYLNLSKNPIENLPKSIGRLLNLQMLKLLYTNLRKLPKCLTNIRNLRHLDISACRFLTTMPIGLEKLTDLITLTDFIVSKKKYSCGLEEVKALKLSGELLIWHLENFKTRNGDNEQKILINKENLDSLRLTWDHHNTTRISNDDYEGTLDILRPHPNLKRLQVHNYEGLKFPTWLANSLLPSLIEVKLSYCAKCEHLPSFGNILSLKTLEIIGMHEVKQIGVEFYGTRPTKGFPYLEKLSFFDMPKFEELSNLEGIQLFSRLNMLTIGKCPSLNSIPFFPSIQSLVLSNCSAPLMESLPKLTTLSSLVMEKIQGLTSLSVGSLSNFSFLRKLHISTCLLLENLPLNDLEKLSLLQSMEITGCPQLASLSFDSIHLTSLHSINLSYCRSLDSLPKNLARIASLRSLDVIGSRNITSWTEQAIKWLGLNDFTIEICNNRANLSGWLHQITNLTTLIINGGHANPRPLPDTLISGNFLKICCCDQLGSLLMRLSMVTSLEHLTLDGVLGSTLPDSIGEIKSLKYLKIYDCAELASLSGSIRGLSRLEVLLIQGCPELERRCQRDTGEDWDIISHVRTVGIRGTNQ